ncbi:hypothetical protein SAMN05428949_0622 [Chitinophaga sp. YR627]|nr:hypothetical protein SAMN05428949_0622 [Chitinophaga sp. YR627]
MLLFQEIATSAVWVSQHANAFIGSEHVDPEMEKINQALRFLGVTVCRNI